MWRKPVLTYAVSVVSLTASVNSVNLLAYHACFVQNLVWEQLLWQQYGKRYATKKNDVIRLTTTLGSEQQSKHLVRTFHLYA